MSVLVVTLGLYMLELLLAAVGSRLAGRCTTWCCALLGLPMWVVGGTIAPFCLALPQLMMPLLAAGLGIAVILLNYYSVSLSEYVSSTPVGALAALLVLILAVGAVVRYLTRNSNLACGVCLVLLAAVAALYFVDSTAFEGLLPSVMSALSLFERFYTFVNGVFDLTAVFYYLTVAALFLFLSVQSLEKRRYN